MLNKKSVLVLIFILFFILPVTAMADPRGETLTFQWEQDISSDFAGWKLYLSQTSGGPYVYAATIDFVSQQTKYTSEEIIDAPDNQVTVLYFVFTAFDTANNESDYSNEVNHEFDFEAPANPFSVTIIVSPQ